jgi:hypothetical protein
VPQEPILIQSLAGRNIQSAQLLGGDGKVTWRNDPGGLVIAPPNAPNNHAVTFEISF